jgi:hypothetical protein
VGTNSSTYTSSALTNSSTVTAVLTSNSSCANPATATSTALTVTINTPPTVTKAGNVLTSSAAASYQWYRNGVLIGGATSQAYTATQSGNYTVAGAGGCQSLPTNVTISGINDPDAGHALVLYPNPSQGSFSISFTATPAETYEIECKSISGATVYHRVLSGLSGSYQLPVDGSTFAPGTYIIMLKSAHGTSTRQLIIQ